MQNLSMHQSRRFASTLTLLHHNARHAPAYASRPAQLCRRFLTVTAHCRQLTANTMTEVETAPQPDSIISAPPASSLSPSPSAPTEASPTPSHSTTTPAYAINITGPLRWWSQTECAAKLNSIHLTHSAIYKQHKKSNDITVYFATPDDKQTAMQLLDAHAELFGAGVNKRFKVKEASDTDLKRKPDTTDDIDRTHKRPRIPIINPTDKPNNTTATADTPAKPPKSVVEVVCPMYDIPYDKQVAYKRNDVARTFRASYRRLTEQFKSAISLTHADQGMICAIERAVPSPVTDGYRNKCEFSCALNGAGQKTAGFQIGRYADTFTSIVEAGDDAPNIPSVAKAAATLFTQHMRASTHDVYDKTTKKGVWRMLTVRNSSANKQLMVCVQLCDADLSAEQLAALTTDVTDCFVEHTLTPEWSVEHDGYQLTSLLLRVHNGMSDVCEDNIQPTVLHGQSYISEKLFDLSFNITLTSFFQVNVQAAELLYKQAAQYAQCDSKTILFDVCCGTGTIGISMAKQVKHVVGLEIVESAVIDARNSAVANGVDNCTFIAGRAEDTIQQALRTHVTPDDHISVIVDPPRPGLHGRVLKLLRGTAQLKRLVYVSCNVKTMVTDIEKLCKPPTKEWRGVPFVPVKATVFDLFPHSDHTEVCMLLER